MRRLVLAISILALAVLACQGGTPKVPPTPQNSVFDSGRTAYGFFPSPIRVEIQSVFDTFKRIGQHADVILLQQNVPWAEFAAGSDVKSQTIIDMTNQTILAHQQNLETIFVVDPLNALNRREFVKLPAGWKPSFGDPNLRTAFKNFALRVVRDFHPRYLGLASEIDTYADAFPEDFSNYVSLYNEVYAAVKAESPQTQVFVTFQWEDLNNLIPGADEGRARFHTNWELVDAFEPNLDLWVISTYPFGSFHSASEIPADYYTPLLTRTLRHSLWSQGGAAKPLAVAEGGFSSEPMPPFGGSDQDQIDYINAIHDQLGPRLAFWIYIIINDLDMSSYSPKMDKDQGTLNLFSLMGFYDVDGNPKPALQVWDSFQK